MEENISLLEVVKRKKIIFRVSLDSIDTSVNDYLRGKTSHVIEGINYLRDLDIDVRINTVITKYNMDCLDSLAHYLIEKRIKSWTLFRLVGKEQNIQYGCFNENIDLLYKHLCNLYGDKLDIFIIMFPKKTHSLFLIDGYGNYAIPNEDGEKRFDFRKYKRRFYC